MPALAEILDLLRQCEQLLAPAGPGARAARALVAEKAEVAAYGLAAAAGVVVEAVADRETVAAGGCARGRGLGLVGRRQRSRCARVEPLLETGWRWSAPPKTTARAKRGCERRRFRVERAAERAEPTVPYYLRRARRGDLYDWRDVPARRAGRAARAAARAGPLCAGDRRPAGDAGARGGLPLRRPGVRRAPPAGAGGAAGGGDAGTGSGPVCRARRAMPAAPSWRRPCGPTWAEPVRGRVRLYGGGSAAVREQAFLACRRGGQRDRALLGQAARLDGPSTRRTPSLELADGRSVGRTLRTVSYPHIRPLAVPVPAVSELSRFELALPRPGRVGYVRGASDRVPEILAAVGLPVELLDADMLERSELAGFDAIVVGSRAYEIDEALRRANGRLLEYARGGGLLVVQYQQYQFVRGGFAPWPLEILRPHGRVTDETAPVEVLTPDHPVFNRPNRLGPADWQGWVQERGLYFRRQLGRAVPAAAGDRRPRPRGRARRACWWHRWARAPTSTPVCRSSASCRPGWRGRCGCSSTCWHWGSDEAQILAVAHVDSGVRPRRLRRRPGAAGPLLAARPRPVAAGGGALRGAQSAGRRALAGHGLAGGLRPDPLGGRQSRRPTSGLAAPTRSCRAAPPSTCWRPTGRPGRTPCPRPAAIPAISTSGSTRRCRS